MELRASFYAQELRVKPPTCVYNWFQMGPENEEAYTICFDHFVPCPTKKTAWDRHIIKAATGFESKDPSICTISDEACAVLPLENHYQWCYLGLFLSNDGVILM
jgi:hypothetical protein